jgi:ribosomal-protein-alanine N-acetyltransferase
MFLKLYNRCNDLFVIAEYSRRIVGYVVTYSEPELAQLISIAVEPQYRRKGVGTALMQYTLTKLTRRRIHSLLLIVRLTNRTALRFYRGFEFTRVGQIAHYYPEDGAAVRLQKILRRSQ